MILAIYNPRLLFRCLYTMYRDSEDSYISLTFILTMISDSFHIDHRNESLTSNIYTGVVNCLFLISIPLLIYMYMTFLVYIKVLLHI